MTKQLLLASLVCLACTVKPVSYSDSGVPAKPQALVCVVDAGQGVDANVVSKSTDAKSLFEVAEKLKSTSIKMRKAFAGIKDAGR
jgi:hypothetical protein